MNRKTLLKLGLLPVAILFYHVYTIHGLLAVLISVQIHELGHYIALKSSDLDIISLDFGVAEIDFEVEQETLTLKQELLVSGSGPLAGILSTILLSPYLNTFLEAKLVSLVLFVIVGVHITNLLPVKGYDGYYIKKALAE